MPPKSLFMRIAREILWSRPPGLQNTPFFSWAFVYGPLCPWQSSWANDYGPPCPCEICGPRSRCEAPKSLFMRIAREISVSRPPGASGRLQARRTLRVAPKIETWRGFKIKHFPKLAFLTQCTFSAARVGDPTRPPKVSFSRVFSTIGSSHRFGAALFIVILVVFCVRPPLPVIILVGKLLRTTLPVGNMRAPEPLGRARVAFSAYSK